MSGLLILGAGGHGRVVADAAKTSGRWTDIAFLDDRCSGMDEVDCVPVLGDLASAPSHLPRFADAAVAVGDNIVRLRIMDTLRKAGFDLPPVVHASAAVSESARIDAGCVVFAGCVINPGAVLGEGCIVNTAATVDHDCRLGAGVHLSPGVHLGGQVVVGARAWLGVGVSVRNGIEIGEDTIVGVGAAVVSDLPKGVVATGVPAAVVRRV